MSGLAAVLAGRHDAGVFTWHSALPVEDVRHAVEHAGKRFGHVDGWTHQSKEEFLEEVGQALSFPSHFGKNLDALVDCLRDVDDTVLLWDGWAPLAREDEGSFRSALDVLTQRAEKADAFVVLLRGDGPQLADVSSLD